MCQRPNRQNSQHVSYAEFAKSGYRLGFAERIKGSHHIFSHPDIEEILNLQPRGSLAKPYQVKQVRKVIIRYKLVPESE